MSDSAAEVYLGWLGSLIKFPDGRRYEHLLVILLNKEFVWLIANDDNRIADGLEVSVGSLFLAADKFS